MSGVFLVKFNDLPTSLVYAPYYILFGLTEEETIDGVFSEFGKPLVMRECDSWKDAEKWAKYLRRRV